MANKKICAKKSALKWLNWNYLNILTMFFVSQTEEQLSDNGIKTTSHTMNGRTFPGTEFLL